MERGDSQILMRIVALLVSFAGIAQRASGRSWPVRCLMLAILRRAEPIARAYALGAGVPALAPIHSRRGRGNKPAELANLSLRFRMLALTLLVAAARILRFTALPDQAWPALPVGAMAVTEAFVKRTCPDTS